MTIREAEAEGRDYPSIERRIHAVKVSPHGQKRRRAERLQRARTASLKREIARFGSGKGR